MPDARPKQPPHKFFRLGDETMAALDRIAARYKLDRTSALRYLIHSNDPNPKPANGAKP